jgi:hypothetical protein
MFICKQVIKPTKSNAFDFVGTVGNDATDKVERVRLCRYCWKRCHRQSRTRSTLSVIPSSERISSLSLICLNDLTDLISCRDSDRRINLNLSSMKALDSAIVRWYQEWVANAPPDYINDDFFPSRIPVAVTSRFGQNQQLSKTHEDREEERLNWARDRDYSRIRYVTLALATHIR